MSDFVFSVNKCIILILLLNTLFPQPNYDLFSKAQNTNVLILITGQPNYDLFSKVENPNVLFFITIL